MADAVAEPPQEAPRPYVRTTGSLSRRMILIAAAWIALLLCGGGFALDRVLTSAITRNFDDQLEYVLTALIVSAEIGPQGEVIFNREPADQRFLEPYSGLYWQVAAKGPRGFPIALALGPPPRRQPRCTWTATSTATTARNFRARNSASWNVT